MYDGVLSILSCVGSDDLIRTRADCLLRLAEWEKNNTAERLRRREQRREQRRANLAQWRGPPKPIAKTAKGR